MSIFDIEGLKNTGDCIYCIFLCYEDLADDGAYFCCISGDDDFECMSPHARIYMSNNAYNFSIDGDVKCKGCRYSEIDSEDGEYFCAHPLSRFGYRTVNGEKSSPCPMVQEIKQFHAGISKVCIRIDMESL